MEFPMKRAPWLRLHAVLVFAFLYLPIAVLSIYSFNGESVGGFPPHGWTLRWYAMLFDDEALLASVGNSLMVAAAAMVIALLRSRVDRELDEELQFHLEHKIEEGIAK